MGEYGRRDRKIKFKTRARYSEATKSYFLHMAGVRIE